MKYFTIGPLHFSCGVSTPLSANPPGAPCCLFGRSEGSCTHEDRILERKRPRRLQAKGLLRVLARSGADIFCCQEIKTRCPLSTPGYLQFWNPAKRPGYSGTLTLARKEPLSVRYGMGIREFDVEGRLITLEYDGFYALNVYGPNSQSGLARLEYRTAWDAALREFLLTLDKPVILCGDFNVAREHIDIYPENLRNEPEPPGFQSLEREGMERLLALGLTDVFRAWHPQVEGAYTWWSMRLNKRLENRGWRLDYFLISEALLPMMQSVAHHTDILGSDHCPISLTLRLASPRKELSDEDMVAMWRGWTGPSWRTSCWSTSGAWPGGFCRPLGPCGRAAEEACAVAGRQGAGRAPCGAE